MLWVAKWAFFRWSLDLGYQRKPCCHHLSWPKYPSLIGWVFFNPLLQENEFLQEYFSAVVLKVKAQRPAAPARPGSCEKDRTSAPPHCLSAFSRDVQLQGLSMPRHNQGSMELMKVRAPYTLKHCWSRWSPCSGRWRVGGGRGWAASGVRAARTTAWLQESCPEGDSIFETPSFFLSNLNCGESILDATASESDLGESWTIGRGGRE